ncbi:MAG: ABC transporter permease, partial [Thermoanaerobaculia bacterium]
MNWLAQVLTLTIFNLRTIPGRRGSVISAVVGVAGVVAVLIGVLAIGDGFRAAMISSGSPDTAIVVRAGSESEMTSILDRETVRIVSESALVARNDGKPLASPELYAIVNIPMRSTGSDANVPFRGVDETAFAVHDDVKLIEGRMFRPGSNEVIAGRGAHLQFAGLDVGATLRFGQSVWHVVGIFEANGGLAESEIWTDAKVLAPAYQRGSSRQIILTKLPSAGSFARFKDTLTADPRLNVKVVRETDYYAEQSHMLHLIITVLGTLISGLMALGAAFGALNTMYTAIAARTREIATLKALGFQSGAVIVSVLIESTLLSIVGGLIGGLLAWAAFDGYRAATLNW